MTMPDVIYAFNHPDAIGDMGMVIRDAHENYVPYHHNRILSERDARIKELEGLLKSANYTYLGDQYVACIDPKKIEQLLKTHGGQE